MTCRRPRLRRPPPGRRQIRAGVGPGLNSVPSMAPAPNPGPSTAVAASGLASDRHLAAACRRRAASGRAGPDVPDRDRFQLAALFSAVLGHPEFRLDRALRRPALSGALSLTLVVVLVLLSRFKHDVAQMTVNFVDLMVIDRDTVAFLFTIFPDLRWSVIADRAGHDSPDVCAVVARSVPHPPAAGARRRRSAVSPRSPFFRWPIRMSPGAAITTTVISRNSRAPASSPSPTSFNTASSRPTHPRRRGSTCRWSIPAIPRAGGRTSS